LEGDFVTPLHLLTQQLEVVEIIAPLMQEVQFQEVVIIVLQGNFQQSEVVFKIALQVACRQSEEVKQILLRVFSQQSEGVIAILLRAKKQP
jgi:hypothetical protein